MHSIYRSIVILLFSALLATLWSCNQVDTAISDPVPDCYDGILNQGEVEIDCGGPCSACQPKLTALVSGAYWQSAGSVTSQINSQGTSILISAGNSNSNMSLIYTGPFVTGTFNLSGALYTLTSISKNYTANTGTITFTQWDNVQKQVFGTFSFKAFETTGTGDSVVVNQGSFTFVPF
jgi:hypothetical protein